MRMKEDAMKNGQLKAGYNVQTGEENRFAIGYDIFDNPADMRTLPVHIENGEKRLGCTFKITIAAAGYGSEENYEYLNKKGIVGLVKYGSYHKKHKKNYKRRSLNRRIGHMMRKRKSLPVRMGKRSHI